MCSRGRKPIYIYIYIYIPSFPLPDTSSLGSQCLLDTGTGPSCWILHGRMLGVICLVLVLDSGFDSDKEDG